MQMAQEIILENVTAADMLQFLSDNGTIDLNDVADKMRKSELQKIIDQHPFEIAQTGKDKRWRTYIKGEDGKRKLIAKSTLDDLHFALYDYYKNPESINSNKKATLNSLYPKWLEYKELHGASPAYIKRIESDWRNYYKGTEIITVPIADFTKLQLDMWAHELIQAKGKTKKQFYNISMIMRQVLDYAVDAEMIPENIFKKVKIDSRRVFDPVKKKPSETQVFTDKEVEDIYDYAWKHFEAGRCTVHKLAPLAIMFQFQTGVRIGELCALRYEDVSDREIFVQRMYRHEEKEVVDFTKCHNEGRYVILTSAAKKLIETARQYQQEHGMPDDGYIFSVNDEPLSYYSVRHLYTRCCKELGILDRSSHKARKTYISKLIDGGVNINTVRELAGHADERTTYNNYCYDRSTKEERFLAVEKALA